MMSQFIDAVDVVKGLLFLECVVKQYCTCVAIGWQSMHRPLLVVQGVSSFGSRYAVGSYS